MKAKFFCKTGLLAGAKYVIDREARIGKDANNHIVLDTKIVSGQHARIFFDDKEKGYFLEDLQSRNGTRLDGLRITEAERLSDLHVITLAEKFDFIFQLVAADGQAADERAAQERPIERRTADGRIGQKTTVAPPREAPRQAPTAKPGEVTKLNQGLAPLPDLRQSGKTVVADRSKDDLQKTVPGGRVAMPLGGLDKDATPRPQDDLQKTKPGGQVAMPSGGFDKDATARPQDDLQKTVPGGRVVMPAGGLDKDATARPQDDLQKTIPGGQVVIPPVFDKDTASRSKSDALKTPPTAATFFLEIKRAGKDATMFTLKEGENIVGRLPDCDIYIDDVSISRQHAVVTVKSRRVMVKDLGSKNRTFIGDREITDEVEIRLDTRLKFGAVEAYLLYKKG